MKIFLIVLIAIIALFGIILVSNIRFKIFLSKDGYIVIKYLFLRFRFDVYGETKLKRVKSKAVKKSDSNKSKKDSKPLKEGYFKKLFDEKGVVEGVVHFLSLIKLIFSKIASLSSKCKINNLVLSVKTASDDAAETAIYYGAVSAVVYPAIGLLNGIFPIKKQKVNILADYNAKKPEIEFAATLKIRVFNLVKAVFSFIKDYIQGGY